MTHRKNSEAAAGGEAASSATAAPAAAESSDTDQCLRRAGDLLVSSPANTVQISDVPATWTEAQLAHWLRMWDVRRVWLHHEEARHNSGGTGDTQAETAGAAEAAASSSSGAIATHKRPRVTGTALVEFLTPELAHASLGKVHLDGHRMPMRILVRSVFRGCSFEIPQHLTVSQRLRLRFLILHAQGTIVTEARDSPFHFVVGHSFPVSDDVDRPRGLVTERWVRESHDANRMLPREGDSAKASSGALLQPSTEALQRLPVPVFAGFVFALSPELSAAAGSAALAVRLREHGAIVADGFNDRVTHFVMPSLMFPIHSECVVTPAWVDDAISTGALSLGPTLFMPSDAWNNFSNPHTAPALKHGEVKWAMQWHAESSDADQPLRDLAADFAALRTAEKAASNEDSTGSSSTSREVDYHALELVPCSELSLPGMLRLLLHDHEIGSALGLPYMPIGILTIIEDYSQYRRPRRGTRGFKFMHFWLPLFFDSTFESDLPPVLSQPATSHFNVRFPFESRKDFMRLGDTIFHDLSAAGRFSAAIGPPLRDPHAALHALLQREKSRTLFGRFAELHVDELRAEDYRLLRASDPRLDEDGLPITECAEEADQIVFPYEATLNYSHPGNAAVRLQLLHNDALQLYQITVATPRTRWSTHDATVTVLGSSQDRQEAVAQFEAAFLQRTRCTWEDREKLRSNDMEPYAPWGEESLSLLAARSAPLAPAASEFGPDIVPPSLPAAPVDANAFRSVFQFVPLNYSDDSL